MRFFDFNIHLPCGCKDVGSRLQDETTMSGSAFEKCFQGYKKDLDDNYVGGNIMILNSSLETLEIESLVNTTKSSWATSCVTVMIDPRDVDWEKRIVEISDTGVTAIKFHCYIQQITEIDIPVCVEISKKAESLGMLVMIDASYGSLGMYQFDNLKLASAIASHVTKTPIILLHSGGARCLEAMLLADATKNIYLETSFTLPYYLGSSIEQDLAFTYKKLGEDRIIYGSDFPYINLEESRITFLNFMEKWGFTSMQTEKIAKHNAMRITKLHD